MNSLPLQTAQNPRKAFVKMTLLTAFGVPLKPLEVIEFLVLLLYKQIKLKVEYHQLQPSH